MANSRNDSDMADQAYELGDRVDNFVDERPLTALAMAVLAGALFARYIFSSRANENAADHSETGRDGLAANFFENLRNR